MSGHARFGRNAYGNKQKKLWRGTVGGLSGIEDIIATSEFGRKEDPKHINHDWKKKALKRFERKIAPFKENIRSVSMDMASSFNLWAVTILPNAVRIIDRFHVIKAFNDRVDKARRRSMAMVDEKIAKKIKGNRYVFLKNREMLTPKEEKKLQQVTEIRERSILAEVHLYKERMRSIYSGAKTYFDASPLFDEWIRDASASDVAELKSAAKTFLKNRDGILAYWSSGGRNSAATEGFNRKTRGLLEMSYGFHEFKFLRLRIFDLGEQHSIKD